MRRLGKFTSPRVYPGVGPQPVGARCGRRRALRQGRRHLHQGCARGEAFYSLVFEYGPRRWGGCTGTKMLPFRTTFVLMRPEPVGGGVPRLTPSSVSAEDNPEEVRGGKGGVTVPVVVVAECRGKKPIK